MAACAVLALAYIIVARACGYDNAVLLRYGGYLLGYVLLPGIVVVRAALPRRPSCASLLALAFPTGFACEILAYLSLSAAGLRNAYPYVPIAWALAAVLQVRLVGWRPCRAALWREGGAALALAFVFLATVVAATSLYFAESPLSGGLPAARTMHDWVYLVSRAAEIKHHWPLQDPSLAGTPLQYHFFLMVHTAAASNVTGLEVSLILLRLAVVPLGGVLVLQAFVLGRRLSGNAAGGVLAALLGLVAGEVSFSADALHPRYLDFFERWLYQSPTFFFGLAFFGALIIAIPDTWFEQRLRPSTAAWLVLLSAAGTGAKGTVLPVLLTALALVSLYHALRYRSMPPHALAAGACLFAGFAPVYWWAMSDWGSGKAQFAPRTTLGLSPFWNEHFGRWAHDWSAWLPHGWSGPVSAAVCAGVILAACEGIRLAALPYLFVAKAPAERALALWLATLAAVSLAMGLALAMDGDSQLYLLLLKRLPLAALAAAGIVRFARAGLSRQSLLASHGLGLRRVAGLAGGIALGAGAVALVIQTRLWVRRSESGFTAWLRQSPNTPVDAEMAQLRDAMLWVRRNTPDNAVLVADAFTPLALQRDSWKTLDGTLAARYYYYSALAERRMLVEGPDYLLRPQESQRRMRLASHLFQGTIPVRLPSVGGAPIYLLVDAESPATAKTVMPTAVRVYSNPRLSVYAVSSLASLASK